VVSWLAMEREDAVLAKVLGGDCDCAVLREGAEGRIQKTTEIGRGWRQGAKEVRRSCVSECSGWSQDSGVQAYLTTFLEPLKVGQEQSVTKGLFQILRTDDLNN